MVSKNIGFYKPDGYHDGASWGLINGLMALAEFRMGRILEGLNYLKIVYKQANRFCLRCIPEAWNSDTGEMILRKPIGYERAAFLLGMSSAAVIKAVEEGLLGIEVDAFKKVIYLKPSITEGTYFRRKRIGSDWVDLKISRTDNKLEFAYKSSKGIKYRIIPLPRV